MKVPQIGKRVVIGVRHLNSNLSHFCTSTVFKENLQNSTRPSTTERKINDRSRENDEVDST